MGHSDDRAQAVRPTRSEASKLARSQLETAADQPGRKCKRRKPRSFSGFVTDSDISDADDDDEQRMSGENDDPAVGESRLPASSATDQQTKVSEKTVAFTCTSLGCKEANDHGAAGSLAGQVTQSFGILMNEMPLSVAEELSAKREGAMYCVICQRLSSALDPKEELSCIFQRCLNCPADVPVELCSDCIQLVQRTRTPCRWSHETAWNVVHTHQHVMQPVVTKLQRGVFFGRNAMEVKELSADMAFCLACPVCGERSCMATFELCQHIISVHIHDDHDRSRMNCPRCVWYEPHHQLVISRQNGELKQHYITDCPHMDLFSDEKAAEKSMQAQEGKLVATGRDSKQSTEGMAGAIRGVRAGSAVYHGKVHSSLSVAHRGLGMEMVPVSTSTSTPANVPGSDMEDSGDLSLELASKRAYMAYKYGYFKDSFGLDSETAAVETCKPAADKNGLDSGLAELDHFWSDASPLKPSESDLEERQQRAQFMQEIVLELLTESLPRDECLRRVHEEVD